MTDRTLLRPLRVLADLAVVGGVAVTVLLSGAASSGSVREHNGESRPVLAAASWHSAPRVEEPARATGLVGVSAYPMLTTRSYESKVLAGINRVRARRHLRPVRPASCAEQVATRWSRHLAVTDELRHQSMQRLLKTCDARYVGEVLGRGSISPNRLVRMWLDSPPHRHVLMSRAPRRIGIGATPNTRGEWVVAANLMTF